MRQPNHSPYGMKKVSLLDADPNRPSYLGLRDRINAEKVWLKDNLPHRSGYVRKSVWVINTACGGSGRIRTLKYDVPENATADTHMTHIARCGQNEHHEQRDDDGNVAMSITTGDLVLLARDQGIDNPSGEMWRFGSPSRAITEEEKAEIRDAAESGSLARQRNLAGKWIDKQAAERKAAR